MVLLASQNAMAGKVYQWMDEDGVVQFSDVAPENTATIDIREININIINDDNADPDEYSIINQLDRMAERRRQITEEYLAIKRLQIEEIRLARETESNRYYVISTRRYAPYTNSYAYPQPYLYYQRRNLHNQSGYYPYPSVKYHRGWLSTDQPQASRHYSRFGIRF